MSRVFLVAIVVIRALSSFKNETFQLMITMLYPQDVGNCFSG